MAVEAVAPFELGADSLGWEPLLLVASKVVAVVARTAAVAEEDAVETVAEDAAETVAELSLIHI